MIARLLLSDIFIKKRNLSLQCLLIYQFVILIAGISGLLVWLSWRSEQETISNLVGQLQNEISDRIEQKLTSYLETPHLINKINADAVRQGILKTQGRSGEIYLWKQIQNFPTVSWIYYGGEKDGGFIGVNRLDPPSNNKKESSTNGKENPPSRQLAISISGLQRYYYSLDQQGNRLEMRGKIEVYDPRQRPWYQAALKTNQPIWSSIYQDFSLPEQVITASLAVYNDQGDRIGVLGADLSLENLCQFLRELRIGKSGQAFIIESSGLLVASSTMENPYEIGKNPQKPERLSVKNINQPMIRATVGQLEQQVGNLSQIKSEQKLQFWAEGKQLFLKVIPYKDPRGINWLIAVVMPEADFMEQIDAKRQTTILLACIALGSAIALGILTTQYINKSLLRLTLASQALANGELEREVPPVQIKELNILSQAFNQMAVRLRQSFADIEKVNEDLETQIAERTSALRVSEELFSKVFWASPYPITISSRLDKRVIAFNESYLSITEYLREDLAGKKVTELPTWVNSKDLVHIVQTLDANGSLRNYEMNYRKKSQQICTALISCETITLNGESCVITVFNDISDRKQIENALSTSEEKFRSLVANLSGIVYRCACKPEWKMEFLGGAVTEMTGYASEDFINNQTRSWVSIIHPEDREMVERIVHEGLICREPFILEYRIIDAQGNIRWFYEKGQAVFNRESELLWLDGAIFDISDRKQVESELLERVHFSILMAEIGSASNQLDSLEEVLQSYVESLWRHMSVDFAQIWTVNTLGTNLDLQANAGHYNQEDSDRLSNLVAREKIWAITQGNFQPLLTDQILADLTETEREWLHQQGIISIAGYPLLWRDRVIGVMLLVSQSHLDTDIHAIESIANAIALGIDHKQAEERLKVTNAEMHALFAAMDEVILVRDRQGRILKIPRTRKKLGWLTPSQVVGKIPSEILSPELSDLFVSTIQNVLETQQTLSIEYNLTDTDKPIWWNASISPIDQETVVWVARDVSDRKLFEQQLKQAKQAAEAASQAKGQFLASMSHELRTPLNAILGFAQLMARDSSLKDTHHSYLKIIHNSGEHLLELINDVLDMSKIESGRITLNLTSFDLHHLLDTLEKMFRLRASDKGLQLIFKRSPQVPQWINADEGKLRQILINLLSNAIKFTNYGSVLLSTEVTEIAQVESATLSEKINNTIETTSDAIDSQSQSLLKFTVEDTGEGIPATHLEKIFEAFEQTELGRQASEGTGLGLPISLKFAQFMGGKILVSSKLGQGSIFQVDLPVKIPKTSGISKQLADFYIIGLAPNQPEYRILVVEDRWESRHFLVKLLEAVGFQVKEAENGAEAIAIWEEWEPHLIWMDMRMPVMDGYEATRQIKSHLKGQATVIIALTASALEEEKAIILSAGCDDFVRKPFREAVILDKLAEYLGVTYLYETEDDHDNRNSKKNDLDILETNLNNNLSQMPDDWIRQLQQAATLADNDLIADLIKDIPINNTVLIQSLISLVDNFCYNQIMNLAQQVLEK
jgi:PAS domain S-box-containing protein